MLLWPGLPGSNVLAFSCTGERQSNMVVKRMGHEFKSHHCVTLDKLCSPSVLQLCPLPNVDGNDCLHHVASADDAIRTKYSVWHQHPGRAKCHWPCVLLQPERPDAPCLSNTASVCYFPLSCSRKTCPCLCVPQGVCLN